MAFYLQNKAIVIVFYRYPQGPYSTSVGLADRPDGFEASIPSSVYGLFAWRYCYREDKGNEDNANL